MADPLHLEWLLEGVEAWNARRAASPFEPNLSRADITAAFAASGVGRPELAGIDLRGANLGRARLDGADLRGADLSGAYLTGASLRGASLREAALRNATLADANMVRTDCREADLRRADLDRADFGQADLRGADLRRAHMEKTHFGGADVTGADLRTERRSDRHAPRFTYLNSARGFTQAQADSIRGDLGTTLPDGLVPPASWPDWHDFDHIERPRPAVALSYEVEPPPLPAPEPAPARATADRGTGLGRQVHFLIRTASAAELTATGLAALIGAAVSEYRANAGNDIPDEVLFMDDLAQTLKALGQRLAPAGAPAPGTAALEAEIERLHAIVAGLTAQLEAASAERESRFVAAFLEKGGSALGGALFGGLGTSLVAGAGFLLGAYAPDAVTAFGEIMGRLTQAAAATR